MGRSDFNQMQREILEQMGLERDDKPDALDRHHIQEMKRRKESRLKAERQEEQRQLKDFPDMGSW